LKKDIVQVTDTPKLKRENLINLPLLFSKKVKTIKVIKPLIHIESDSGKAKHYTPASQE